MQTVATQTVEIRPVGREDLGAVYKVEEQCFKDPFPSYFIDELADANPETFVVAIYSGTIVGYAVVDNWSDHQHLVSIAVIPGFRRRGMAQLILDRLLASLKPGPLRLELRKSNEAALALYLKNGFHQTGVAHSYYRDGEDAIQMEKQIEKNPEILASA